MGKNEHFVSFKDFIFFKLEENGEKLENFKLKMENCNLRHTYQDTKNDSYSWLKVIV
jgi:hypothetical protein